MTKKLLIVIPTHGRADLLGRTLQSLSACSLPPEFHETIVIENGSRCGTEQTVRSCPPSLRARYIYEEKGNKSLALNRVLGELDEDAFLFFTDDDVRVVPTILESYMAQARRTGPGAFFGGPTSCDYEKAPPRWLKSFLPASAVGWKRQDVLHEVVRACFLGFNWGAFASDLKALDGFDFRRGPGSPSGSTGQESEMQQRMLAHGMHAWYIPDALVWHYVPTDRCSAEWTLNRAFRNGVQCRLAHAADGRSATLHRLDIAKILIMACLRAAPSPPSLVNFIPHYAAQFLRGYRQPMADVGAAGPNGASSDSVAGSSMTGLPAGSSDRSRKAA